MLQKPHVSCVITTYNRAHFIRDAIDSILNQRYPNYELIVIDDGSTDDTALLVKEVYGSRLRYFLQENKGISAARNLGIEVSNGKYIAFLDSDDLWSPDKLSIQTRFMRKNPRYCLCYTNEIWSRNGMRVNQRKRHRKYSGFIFKKCLPLCIISPSSALICKKTLELMGGFDEGLPAAEDYDLWLRITARYPVFFIPLPLVTKRGGHPDQLSRVIKNLDMYRIKALVKLLSNTTRLSYEYREAVLGELAEKCSIYGMGCKRHGRIADAEYYLKLPQKIMKNVYG